HHSITYRSTPVLPPLPLHDALPIWGLAVEILNAAQALSFHEPLKPGPGVAAALRAVREVVPPLDADRLMTGDLAAVREMIIDGRLRDAVEAAVGPLN